MLYGATAMPVCRLPVRSGSSRSGWLCRPPRLEASIGYTVSCIETSTICPRPVRSRWNRAAVIAANRWTPPEKSTKAAPALVGGPSGCPVAAAAPDIACTVMSMADMWA
jgi:hypothetical protein